MFSRWLASNLIPGALATGFYMSGVLTRAHPDAKDANVVPSILGERDLAGPLAGAAPRSVFRRVSVNTCGDGFISEYDGVTRNPRWVVERITADGLRLRQGHTGGRAEKTFHEDRSIPVHLRAHLGSYAGSGWDRGHLAAAANHASHDEQTDIGDDVLRDTFLLSNVSPQAGEGFNRDCWAKLEAWVRGLLHPPDSVRGSVSADVPESTFDEVLICTGPLWVPRSHELESNDRWRYEYQALGSPFRWVAVPTHFYKVVAARLRNKYRGLDEGDTPSEWAVGAFVMQNAAPSPPGRVFRPLDYAVPIVAVEALAGVEVSADSS